MKAKKSEHAVGLSTRCEAWLLDRDSSKSLLCMYRLLELCFNEKLIGVMHPRSVLVLGTT